GQDTRLILSGPAPHASWTPGVSLDLTPQARLLLESIYRDDPAFALQARQALALTEELARDEARIGGSPGSDLAAFAAGRLNASTRIAAFSINGWDTHRDQDRAIRGSLGQLRDAVLRLRDDLGPNWERTAVLAMT